MEGSIRAHGYVRVVTEEVVAQTASAGHGQGQVPGQGGVAADLAVGQAEIALAEPEIFLDRPAAARDADQGGEGAGRRPGGLDAEASVIRF